MDKNVFMLLFSLFLAIGSFVMFKSAGAFNCSDENPYKGASTCPECLFRFSKKLKSIDLPDNEKYFKVDYFKCPLCGHEFIVRYKRKEYVENEIKKKMIEGILD